MMDRQSWAGIQNISWVPVLNNTLEFGSQYKIVPTEGYIAWEYNPLRNYRLSESMYERDGKYQLYVKEVSLDGEGDLFKKYEQLKKELMEKLLKN